MEMIEVLSGKKYYGAHGTGHVVLVDGQCTHFTGPGSLRSARQWADRLQSPKKRVDRDHGYLQHGQGTSGPFRTERVDVRNQYADNWQAWFEGRWRNVHIQVNRTYIVYRGERITIQIDGV